MSSLQELHAWKKDRQLPPANEKWPTALIIAPSSVVPNWEREFATVSVLPLRGQAEQTLIWA